MLLHVAFYAKIGSDTGDFDMKDVCDRLCEKLIFRHPHVFGDVKAETDVYKRQGTASPLNQDKKLDKGFLVLDFSSFNTPGQYFLSIGDVQSKPFPIGNDAYLSTAWHTLNFFFSERCGFDQQMCIRDSCISPSSIAGSFGPVL